MNAFKFFKRKRSRKYPVIRDESGKSARKRVFEIFENGDPVTMDEIAKTLGIKLETVYKYHQQWLKNPHVEQQIKYLKEVFNKEAPDRDDSIKLFAQTCKISADELESIISKPHGLRRFLNQKFYFPVRSEVAHRRYIALELANLISEHLIKDSGKFEDVYVALRRLMKQAKEDRKEKEAEIEENNQTMSLVHKLLANDLDEEKLIIETFTPEEREKLIRWGINKRIKEKWKQTQAVYWARIGELTTEGYTEEQAREKIYQDLIDKGDLQGAKQMRDFQNWAHPLTSKGGAPPDLPNQTPQSTQ